MKSLEKIILEEISTMDEMRLIDVIGFIRYLKADKPFKKSEVTDWFEITLQSIREQEQDPKSSLSQLKDQSKKKHDG